MMIGQDQIHRYLFEKMAVRGELVNVSNTCENIIAGHDYPLPVQQLLGELLIATSLLTATLKFKGDITVQLQGDGALKLAVINGNHRQQMRGVARVQGDIDINSTLKQMTGDGYLAITLSPAEGERYQSLVALEQDTLTTCLENYFLQSEQLPTRLFLRTGVVNGRAAAAGILLQVLPSGQCDRDDFNHLATLTDTIHTSELFTLPANDVLWRLYHQEEVTVYDPQPVTFHCACSRERCRRALKTLTPSETDRMIKEDGQIDMHCDYCGQHYLFDAADITEE